VALLTRLESHKSKSSSAIRGLRGDPYFGSRGSGNMCGEDTL